MHPRDSTLYSVEDCIFSHLRCQRSLETKPVQSTSISHCYKINGHEMRDTWSMTWFRGSWRGKDRSKFLISRSSACEHVLGDHRNNRTQKHRDTCRVFLNENTSAGAEAWPVIGSVGFCGARMESASCLLSNVSKLQRSTLGIGAWVTPKSNKRKFDQMETDIQGD